MEKTNKRFKLRPALAAGLAAALIVGCMGAAYAADLGGIQETVRMWFGGSAVEAQVVDHSTDTVGAYDFTMTGPDGEVVTHSAGGTSIDDDGTQHPMSAQEVAQVFAAQVVEQDDGTVWLYDHDQAYDITDYLAGGQYKFALEVEGKAVYYHFCEDGEHDQPCLTHTRFYEATGPLEEYIQLR